MFTILVCLGSSCYLKGAYDVIGAFEEAIDRAHLGDYIELKGAFCLNRCTDGVTVNLDGELLVGVVPEDVSHIFEEKILPKLRRAGNECSDH